MLISNVRQIFGGRQMSAGGKAMFSFSIERKIIKFLGGLSPPWQKILAPPLMITFSKNCFYVDNKHETETKMILNQPSFSKIIK
jgi:hypothetical protein